jgi:hypothetical protein
MATDAGLAAALTHASERSQGALQAGDSVWAARQQAAESRYAASLAGLIRARVPLRVRARATLDASRFPAVAIAAADVTRAQEEVRLHGFPGPLERALVTVGLSAAERQQFAAAFLARDPSAISARSFPAVLTTGDLNANERASANAFQLLAAATATPKPTKQGGRSAASWTGRWNTNFGAMRLLQSGRQVTGTYATCGGTASIGGRVNGSNFDGTWSQRCNSRSGRLHFSLATDGRSFRGTWSYGNATPTMPWNGKRA